MSSNSSDTESFLDNIATVLSDAEQTIGTITLLWGNAHHMVFRIFAAATEMRYEVAEAVFFAVRTDSAQRDMTLAAVDRRLGDIPLARNIRTAIKDLGNTAGERNAFIHTMWTFSVNDKAYTPYPTIRKSKKLRKDADQQAKELIETLVKHRNKLVRLMRQLLWHLASHDKSE